MTSAQNKFQIQNQNATSCTAWDEGEGELVDHDYATFYDSREEAQAELDAIKNGFANPDELDIISVTVEDAA